MPAADAANGLKSALMERLVLIHWKLEEVAGRLARLEAAGLRAEAWDPRLPGAMARYRKQPPPAILIDLSRLPSHGRACASALRQQKAYRHVPIIFVGGAPEKVEQVRATLPDAIYAEWDEIAGAIRRALAHPVANPLVPVDLVTKPAALLSQKLTIRRDTVVALLDAPAGFESRLEPLPASVRVQSRLHARTGVALIFVTSRGDFERSFEKIQTAAARGCRVWVIWPKKSSALACDLDSNLVRQGLLDLGLVDYKICSVDDTWSGMLFAMRRKAASSSLQ